MTGRRSRAREFVASRRAEIRRAIEGDELVLHYQPIVELDSGRVRGVEALLRWQHPVGGLLAPDDFLPGLAQTPVIADITRWVIRAACRAALDWPGWDVAVNITARDVLRLDFVDDVTDALASSGLPAGRLVLELTETALVQDLPLAADSLGQLRALGVGVALDDFGTGYSSMLYLRDLPVTIVKIDRAFVGGVGDASENRAIVSSLLTLARAVGLTSIAEGVEAVPEARVLTSLGCVLAQGYLWSRPVPPVELAAVHRDGTIGPESVYGSPDGDHADPRSRLAAHLLSQGASLHTIAAALNTAGHRTDRGTRWHPSTVAHLVNAIPSPGPPSP